jgi:hypothetical protein
MGGIPAKWLIVGAGLIALAACGRSPEEKVYEAFRCAKVAMHLDRGKDADTAMENAIPYMREVAAHVGSPARYTMMMNERFQEDVPLYRLALGSQMELLSSIYDTDRCQELYKPSDVRTEAGEINMAGCEVPAGITLAEAERMGCDQSSPDVKERAHNADNASDEQAIAIAIAEQAARDGSTEFAEARRVMEGDLTGDGRLEVVVLYTLEGAGGSNGSVTYLAAFARDARQLKLIDTTLVAGREGADNLALSEGEVRLKLLVQGPEDPDCCPTGKEDVTYLLHGNKWMRVLPQR